MTTNERIARALGIQSRVVMGITVWPDFEHDANACVAAWPKLRLRTNRSFRVFPVVIPDGDRWKATVFTDYYDSFCAAWVAAACDILGIQP